MIEQSGPPDALGTADSDRHYARLTQCIGEDDKTLNGQGRGPVVYVLLVVFPVILILVVWIGYMRGLEARREAAPIPRIAAIEEPYKQRVEVSGSGPVDHADKRIFDQVDGYVPSSDVSVDGVEMDDRVEVLDPVAPAPDLRERPATTEIVADSVAEVSGSADNRPELVSRSSAVGEVGGEVSAEVGKEAGSVKFVSAWTVQLASMPSRGDAEVAWRRMSGRHDDLFSGLDRTVIRVDLGRKGIFFRLRARGFADRSEARDFCARYKERGGDCFVVRS